MRAHAKVIVALTFATTFAAGHEAMLQSHETPQSKRVGLYATINGVRMYYELVGPEPADQPPLVLLHGALSTIATDFGELLPRLAETRRVIAIEQQGHGHTEDVANRPLSYETMGDDTAALLKHLGVRSADFFGYSMGGGISLQVARRHHDLVQSVVFAGGASFDPSGFYPGVKQAQETMTPDMLDGSPFQKDYARVAPDPGNWRRLVEKTIALDRTWHGMSPADLRAMSVPTLLIIGDADIVTPEHTVAMFRLLGGGVAGDLYGLPRAQLAILPGITHLGVVHRVDWLASMVTAFTAFARDHKP